MSPKITFGSFLFQTKTLWSKVSSSLYVTNTLGIREGFLAGMDCTSFFEGLSLPLNDSADLILVEAKF